MSGIIILLAGITIGIVPAFFWGESTGYRRGARDEAKRSNKEKKIERLTEFVNTLVEYDLHGHPANFQDVSVNFLQESRTVGKKLLEELNDA